MVEKPNVKPELDRAVLKLLQAEVEFTRAYTDWVKAPRGQRPARKDAVDEWEQRIEAAMREAQERASE